MKVILTLNVSPEDTDAEHSMGITNDAYERLSDALMQAGFDIVSGPDRADRDRRE